MIDFVFLIYDVICLYVCWFDVVVVIVDGYCCFCVEIKDLFFGFEVGKMMSCCVYIFGLGYGVKIFIVFVGNVVVG